MAAIISEGKGSERRWRLRWREGGRGSKLRTSERYETKRDALDALQALEARLAAIKPMANRLVISWTEIRVRWLKLKTGRYALEAARAMDLHTKGWSSVRDATPAALAMIPMGALRSVKACLRWADLHLGQSIDYRVLRVVGVRKRAKRVRPQLLDDAEVARLVQAAQESSPGNGAIAHLVATYGHRAENLVRLTADNFTGGRLTFRVKGGEEISHSLLEATQSLLSPLLATKGPIFLNHLGVPWRSGQEFAAWFHHWLGVCYYQLKRAAISRWLAKGADPKTIASITGHKTVSLLLDTYAATNEHRQAAALAMLRADAKNGVPGVFPNANSEVAPKAVS